MLGSMPRAPLPLCEEEVVYCVGTVNMEAPEKKISITPLRLGTHAVRIDRFIATWPHIEGWTIVHVTSASSVCSPQ